MLTCVWHVLINITYLLTYLHWGLHTVKLGRRWTGRLKIRTFIVLGPRAPTTKLASWSTLLSGDFYLSDPRVRRGFPPGRRCRVQSVVRLTSRTTVDGYRCARDSVSWGSLWKPVADVAEVAGTDSTRKAFVGAQTSTKTTRPHNIFSQQTAPTPWSGDLLFRIMIRDSLNGDSDIYREKMSRSVDSLLKVTSSAADR